MTPPSSSEAKTATIVNFPVRAFMDSSSERGVYQLIVGTLSSQIRHGALGRARIAFDNPARILSEPGCLFAVAQQAVDGTRQFIGIVNLNRRAGCDEQRRDLAKVLHVRTKHN